MNHYITRKIIITIFLVALIVFSTTTITEVQAKTYAFTVTITPTQVEIAQVAIFSAIITDTGESSLGSTTIAIPDGLTVLAPIAILNPTTLWNYTITATAISVSATEGGGVISPGENVTFTFGAIAPTTPSVTNWTIQATTSIQGGGVSLTLEVEQPTLIVTSTTIVPPSIQASPNAINQDQTSLLAQSSIPSGGTPPYTFQWLEAYDGETFTPISGATESEYTFSPTIATPTGTWQFKLNVADNSLPPETTTSNVVNITLNPKLIAPTLAATPNQVTQNQPSNLDSSPITTGTSPYTYQWYQKAPGQSYAAVGEDSSTLAFPGTMTTGTWTFLLQITDSTGASVNSTSLELVVTTAPVFTINVTQTAHGTINPGTLGISQGDNQFFEIMPYIGYYVSNVLVDGTSVGAVLTYYFVNVTANHSIEAAFSPIDYSLSVSEIGNGSVTMTPIRTTFHYGDTILLTAIPASGWRFGAWTGDLVGVLNPTTVTIDGNKEVIATFVANQSRIISSATQGGQLIPSGTIFINHNGSQTFTITPDTGYHIENVLINGTNVGPVSTYTIANVVRDTTISASFAPNVLTITAQTSTQGSINPTGIIQVNYGDSQSFTITPEIGCYVYDVLVDGISVGPVTDYTFPSVTSDHNITANFAANITTYFITVESMHGSATSSAQVNSGGNFTVSVTNPESETNHRWICTGCTIDDSTAFPNTVFTFTNIKSNHTITFNWQEQYYLNVSSDVGSTIGTGWYDIGSTATVSVSNNIIAMGSGKRHVFIGWAGDATGTDTTSNEIVINEPETAIATWKIQYQVIYAITGNTLEENNNSPEWVDAGTPPVATFQRIITNPANNTRYILVSDNRPTTINGSLTVTAIYQTQYLVTFTQDGINQDTEATVEIILNGNKSIEKLPTSIWINSGDSITFSYTTTVKTPEDEEQYVLKNSNSTSPLTINEPLVIHGYYEYMPISSGFDLETLALPVALATIPTSVALPIVVTRKRKKWKKIKPIINKGGFISPNTVQKINTGGDSTIFIIAADSGYEIVDVVIDKSEHLGPLRTYKFVNVTRNHTISAIFQKN